MKTLTKIILGLSVTVLILFCFALYIYYGYPLTIKSTPIPPVKI